MYYRQKGGGFTCTDSSDRSKKNDASKLNDAPPRRCAIKLNKEETFYVCERIKGRRGHKGL